MSIDSPFTRGSKELKVFKTYPEDRMYPVLTRLCIEIVHAARHGRIRQQPQMSGAFAALIAGLDEETKRYIAVHLLSRLAYDDLCWLEDLIKVARKERPYLHPTSVSGEESLAISKKADSSALT